MTPFNSRVVHVSSCPTRELCTNQHQGPARVRPGAGCLPESPSGSTTGLSTGARKGGRGSPPCAFNDDERVKALSLGIPAIRKFDEVRNMWKVQFGRKVTREYLQQLEKKAIAKIRKGLLEDRLIRTWLLDNGIEA